VIDLAYEKIQQGIGAAGSPERQAWIQARDAELDLALQNSVNTKPIEDWMWKAYDVQTDVKHVDLKDGRSLHLFNRGLHKPKELVMVDHQNETVIFSNLTLDASGHFGFIDFSLSPDEKTVAMSFDNNGSLDAFRLVVVDIASKQVLNDNIPTLENSSAWTSNTDLIFSAGTDPNNSTLGHWSLNQPTVVTQTDGDYPFPPKNGWTAIWNANNQWELVSNQGQTITIELQDIRAFVGATPDHVFLLTRNASLLEEIRAVPITATQNATATTVVVRPAQKQPLITSQVLDGAVITVTRWGADRTIQIFDPKTFAITADFPVPDCCSVKLFKWNVPGHLLDITLTSDFVKTKVVTYDLDKKAWQNIDFTSAFMTTPGGHFVSEVVQYPSFDGTMIPMRLTHRKDLVLDSTNPVYVDVYGGFYSTGYIDPYFSPPIAEFMRRGGVYAAPALRGGNELGEAWHQAATLQNKPVTMKDMIAGVQWLVANHWTQANLICSHGTSNGGLTVASSGLLAPSAFGLVIPASGVDDLLHKESYDPEFGPGWNYEYGDSRNAPDAAWLKTISPVVLAEDSKAAPKFLVMVGLDDSRVNPQHSFDLTEALKLALPNDTGIFMDGVDHSGHWLESPSYQDVIGWHSQVVEWTFVFDQVGWTF
jgi:prolyl oligopeptidase PreP (S9A serine peptidase family)